MHHTKFQELFTDLIAESLLYRRNNGEKQIPDKGKIFQFKKKKKNKIKMVDCENYLTVTLTSTYGNVTKQRTRFPKFHKKIQLTLE